MKNASSKTGKKNFYKFYDFFIIFNLLLNLLENTKYKNSITLLDRWERFKRVINSNLKDISSNDLNFKDKVVLELGCGNSYVLSSLKKLGFKTLYGIDSSIETKNLNGISFIKKFITEKSKIPENL